MGDLFKSGRVRVSLHPNPFQPGTPFRQTLDLATGPILIEAAGLTLRIWADASVYSVLRRSEGDHRRITVDAH